MSSARVVLAILAVGFTAGWASNQPAAAPSHRQGFRQSRVANADPTPAALKRAALKAASQSYTLGVQHPTSVRIEYIRDLNGTREAVLVMRGHFTLRRQCHVPGAPCPKGNPTASVLVIDLTLPLPSAGMGFQTESLAQAAALTAARNSSPRFKIFTDFVGSAIRCSIPSGGRFHRAIAAACTTSDTRTPNGRQVRFRERWPLLPLRNGHWPPGTKMGGWIVTVVRGHVRSVREWGDTPPQLWR